ncbi:hypothetical protein ERK14_06745 [Lactobacillus kunkeei]|nr:hypothetical protein [Apilactobacillus kunkeei]
MKTLQDLVDRLNGINHLKPFSIEHYYDKYYLVVEYSIGTKNTVVEFSQLNYRFHEDIAYLHPLEQNIIVDYLANSNPKDWFPEKKYNIIIGGSVLTTCATAYCKDGQGKVMLDTFTSPSELKLDDYQFTESEIEELKSTLPTNMAKIVDLGKVEVKDD